MYGQALRARTSLCSAASVLMAEPSSVKRRSIFLSRSPRAEHRDRDQPKRSEAVSLKSGDAGSRQQSAAAMLAGHSPPCACCVSCESRLRATWTSTTLCLLRDASRDSRGSATLSAPALALQQEARSKISKRTHTATENQNEASPTFCPQRRWAGRSRSLAGTR